VARKSKDIEILVKLATQGNFDEAQRQLERLKTGQDEAAAGGVGAIGRLKGAWSLWTKTAQVSARGIRTAFLTVLGPIGAIIQIAQTLISTFSVVIRFVRNFRRNQDEANKTVEQATSAIDAARRSKERYADITGIERLREAIKAHEADLKSLDKNYEKISEKVEGAGRQWWNIVKITSTTTRRYQEQLALLSKQRSESERALRLNQDKLAAEQKLEEAAAKRARAEEQIADRIARLTLEETEFKLRELEKQLFAYEKAGADRVQIERLRAAEMAQIETELSDQRRREEEARTRQLEKENKEREKLEEETAQYKKDLVENLADFQNWKSKEMAAIGRSVASGEALVSTYLAAQKAVASLAGIPVVGPALAAGAAAAITAQGLARVAKINAVELEKGGVATEETLARIGEHGKKEAVLPLEDKRAMKAISEAINIDSGAVSIQNHFHGFGGSPEEVARRVTQLVFQQVRDRTPEGSRLVRVISSRTDTRRAF